MTAPLVLLTLFFCHAGSPDDCDDIEIRAQSCPHALQWALAWLPPGAVAVNASCVEQRQAAR